jgi:ubiquinone/menaquinone biosynthesis C-methylase UbiE
MESIVKDKIKEFGNPSAYHENRLYHLFCEQGKEDLYYFMIFYGLYQDEKIDVSLNSKYESLLFKTISHQQKRIKNISRFIYSKKAPGLWLDMGCGVGQFMNRIIQLNGNYAIGTDISFNVLKKASFLLDQVSHSKYYCMVNQDPLELPFKHNTFDYILSADVLEHVGYDNQERVFSEMFRVLKTGGKAIVHTPNLNRVIFTTFLRKMYYLVKGINPFNIKHSFPKDHISLITSNRLKAIGQSVGFDTKIYQQIDWKLYDLFPKWAFLGLDLLFSRSFILGLAKKN